MATEVLVPKLGMTMTTGTVAEWLVPDGGEVRAGEMIYRLETEKIEFQVEAETDGIVRHLVAAGTELDPGTVVAYVLAPGEQLPAGAAPAAATPVAAAMPAAHAPGAAGPRGLPDGRVPSSPIARRLAREAGLQLATIAGSGPGGRITEADVLHALRTPAGAPAAPAPAAEVPASPLARRLAATLGVDLGRVRGTGPGGRITKEDVEAAAAAPPPRVPAPVAAAATPARAPGEVIPLRGMRKAIAERMHASLQEMAQLTMGMDVLMDDAVKLRSQLVDEWAPEGIRPSYTDLVIKAVAKALRHHPVLNARFTPEGIVLEPGIHVGMAVAVDDGLVVPVIRDADARPLRDIAADSTRLAEAARAGRLALDDMAGHTFSVTTLGMAGIDFFTPIVNPPDVAILGVGRIHDALHWDGDRPVRRQAMTLSLTIDHRAVDGAPGAAFLGAVRDLLEAPYRLLV